MLCLFATETTCTPFWLKPASVFPDFTWQGTATIGHTRALVTLRTVGESMVYINNNQLASEFLQLLSGDGQTIDNDIQRRAGTVTTSLQLQKSIGNILGRPFHSLRSALLAASQVQKASNSAKHVWTPSTAQGQYFSTSLSSEDDPVSVAEKVQQQAVEVPVPQILKETVEVDEIAPFERVQQQTVEVPMPHILKETVDVTEYVAPAPAVTYIATAPVIEHVSSTPDATSAAPAPVIEDVTPAPADSYTTPAPVIDFVAPSPVIEYIALATSLTVFSLSHHGSRHHWCQP